VFVIRVGGGGGDRVGGGGGWGGGGGGGWLAGSEQGLFEGFCEHLNEMRGICRPSKQPVVAVPRSFLLPLFAFSITSFPNLRFYFFCVKVFVSRALVSRLTHYILICRDIKES